jgi:cyclopropane fatty-acyl-phospholipid synthase-like methyltransferase
MEPTADFYDEKYFEDGVASGKSCYTNYRWIPELTIPMAHHYIRELNIRENESVLDVGCSKGYFVKALRLLGIEAFGTDVSKYAIDNVDSEIKKYCKLVDDNNLCPFNRRFHWVVTKDVLEHMTDKNLEAFFRVYSEKADYMHHVVPLGDDGKFRIPEYHLDKSHIQIFNEEWWSGLFKRYGWEVIGFKYKTAGIKEAWSKHHPKGNGFFTLVRS